MTCIYAGSPLNAHPVIDDIACGQSLYLLNIRIYATKNIQIQGTSFRTLQKMS